MLDCKNFLVECQILREIRSPRLSATGRRSSQTTVAALNRSGRQVIIVSNRRGIALGRQARLSLPRADRLHWVTLRIGRPDGPMMNVQHTESCPVVDQRAVLFPV